MTSLHVQQQAAPEVPAGWERAKSASVKPRALSSVTASASPMASAAVVLAVGARFSGQASAGTPMSRCTVGIAGQGGVRIAGEGDQRNTQPLDARGRMVRISARLAGIGQRQHGVVARDHADVAVAGLGRVHEEGGGAGAGQRGGDLAADVAGFAHAGHDHPAAAAKTNAAGARKIRPEARQLRLQAFDLDGQRLATEIDQAGRR